MQFYNPNKPEWSERATKWHEYDAQIDRTNAFTFNAASFADAVAKAKEYGAYKLTQFARPLRIVRTETL
jgi:hypothetical protein